MNITRNMAVASIAVLAAVGGAFAVGSASSSSTTRTVTIPGPTITQTVNRVPDACGRPLLTAVAAYEHDVSVLLDAENTAWQHAAANIGPTQADVDAKNAALATLNADDGHMVDAYKACIGDTSTTPAPASAGVTT